ncbi:hypothetical protein ACS0TY_000053 [Phlomoides rotata]
MEFSRVEMVDLEELSESFSNLEILDLVNVRANETQEPASATTEPEASTGSNHPAGSDDPTGNTGTTYIYPPVPKMRHQLQKNYDQLTLHVKVSGNVQQVDLDIVQTSIHGVGYAQRMLWKALERPLLKTGSPSVTHKEKVHQVEPRQVPQVIGPGKADSAYTSPSPKEKGQLAEPSQGVPIIKPEQTGSSSNLEETEHQASKPDVSGQPTTSGVKEGDISLRPQKGPKQADTNIAGSH